MEQKFKIMDILNFRFSKIDELEDITDESIKNYMTHGVWVLFGRKKEQLWTCLQWFLLKAQWFFIKSS